RRAGRLPPGRRSQHAELLALEEAREDAQTGALKARYVGDDRGVPPFGGIPPVGGELPGRAVRAGRADFRAPHPQHPGSVGRSVRAEDLPPADRRGSVARDRQAPESHPALSRGDRRRSGRPDRRGPSAPRAGALRRAAGPAAGDVRGAHGAGAPTRPRRRPDGVRSPAVRARTVGKIGTVPAMTEGLLVLEDGTSCRGEAIGARGTSFGEIVFNTAMSGYQEVLTDPSYAGQIVVMTAAHIGNYGVRRDEAESERVHVAGFVARDFPERWSGAGGERSLADYLAESGVIGLHGLDTRSLVR